MSGEEEKVILLDTANGQKIKEFRGHQDYVTSVVFLPDCKSVASGSWDQTVKIWDIASGNEIKSFPLAGGYCKSLCASQDGQFILAGSTLGQVEMWNVQTGQRVKIFAGHKDEVRGLAYSGKGDAFLSVSMDCTVKWWDIAQGTVSKEFSHDSPVYVTVLSADSRFALSGSADKQMKLWDLASGSEIFAPTGHVNGVTALTLLNKKLASGSDDKTGKVWNTCNGQESSSYGSYEVSATAFHPAGEWIATGGWDTISLWNIGTGQLVREFKGHSNTIRWIHFSEDGNFMYSTGLDGNIKKWDVQTGAEILNIFTQNSIECVLFLPESESIVCGQWNGDICGYSIKTKEKIFSFKAHGLTVLNIGFIQDGKYLVSASDDQYVKIWETTSWTLVKSLQIGAIRRMAMIPSKDMLVLILAERKLEFLSCPALEKIQDIVQTTQPVCLAVKEDGCLFVGNVNGNIHLYKMK